MKSAPRFALVAIAALTLISACTSPPGPAPGNPAPNLPADAVAYDDLKSTDRKFPFKGIVGDCTQITPQAIAAAGLKGSARAGKTTSAAGCFIPGDGQRLEQLAVLGYAPDQDAPAGTRVFPKIWNGKGDIFSRSESNPHFRRFLLLNRYYAVETLSGSGISGVGCIVTVDTGSPFALQFSAQFTEQYSKSTYPRLSSSDFPNQVSQTDVKQFVADGCPDARKAAESLIGAIDPNGGSLGLP